MMYIFMNDTKATIKTFINTDVVLSLLPKSVCCLCHRFLYVPVLTRLMSQSSEVELDR